jgi:hypothetical protein
VNGGGVDCDALKGGRPSPDFMPPSAPSNLGAAPVASHPGRHERAVQASGLRAKAAANPRRVKLSSSASTDDVGVTAYQAYRDGVVIATVGVVRSRARPG